MPTPHQPYREALTRALAGALVAGWVVAGVDVAMAISGRSDAPVLDFALRTASLYGGVALLVGLVAGLVLGALAATHGNGFIRRAVQWLADDRERDHHTVAILCAGAVCLVELAAFVALVSALLVGTAERKSTAAILSGLLSAAAVPLLALGSYPIYRTALTLSRQLPRTRRPKSLLLLGTLVVAAVTLPCLVITTQLDWRALPLGAPMLALLFATIAVLWIGLAPKRSDLWAKGAGATTLVAMAIFFSPASEATFALLSDAPGVKIFLAVGRRLTDHDGDGYSARFGGGDCDDRNPNVHPGAFDEPENGVDENCQSGDAKKPAARKQATAPGTTHFDDNVLILAIDTLRADRLGYTGYQRGGKSLTPRIDEFAAGATTFRRTYSQAPNTPRSFPSLFFSRLPSHIRWDQPFQNYPVALGDNVSLFEVLSQSGFRTVGVSSHFYFTKERGITQGFVEYDNDGAQSIKDSNHDIAAPRVAPRVGAKLKELARSGQKFALFAHLFEPHSTYMEHPEFPIRSRGLEGLEEKYDYEIAFVDRYVGEILDALKTAGLSDNTMVVLLSDHGEGFGEHKVGREAMYFHGQTLYDELLRVPLLIRAPGQKPHTVDEPVMLLDVAPTILEALGVLVPESFEGRSLAAAVRGKSLVPEPVYAELEPAPSWNHAAKMRLDADGKTKLVHRISDSRYELYDLARDPKEQHDLFSEDHARADSMKQKMTAWLDGGP